MRMDNLIYLYCGSRPRSKTGRPLILAVVVFAIAISGAVAWSQVPPRGAYGQNSANDPMLQQLIAARAESRDAEKTLSALTEKIKKRLETQDPEWVNRSRAAHDAEVERDRVRDAVLDALKSKPAYMDALAAQAKAQETMQQLTDAHETFGKDFKAADDRDYAMRNKIHEMEQQALHDSQELKSAEAHVRDTKQNVDDYWERYVIDVLVKNATWTQAVQRRDEAVAAAQATEAAFVQSRRQVAGAPRTGSGGRSNGSRSGYGSRNSYGSRSGSSRSSGSYRGNSWSSRSR